MSQRLFIGTRKGLFVLERSGGWRIAEQHFLGEPVTMLLDDGRDATTYCALNLGHFGVKFWRSRDGRKTWQECAAPTYPEQPADLPAGSPAWSLKQIWSLEAADPARPGSLWAGTNPGGLFRSDDGGESWTLNRALWDRPERLEWMGGGNDTPGIHSVVVDPRNARSLSVGVSCGGVWRSDDAGSNWRSTASGMRFDFMPDDRAGDPNIQDPHRVVQCADRPDILWTQHHCGIYRSVDRGESWQSIGPVAPSAFGFAVAVHPRDPEHAWFVPAIKDERRIPVDGRLVVTRTRDGGKSFEALRTGLPQADCYDLIYRHGLDIDAAGDTLAMGSTTGALWVGESQGERWTLVNAHLPPINCVRFGAE